MEIQRHPSHYANAAQWLRYSNVSHPGDVEELTQTEQGSRNTEGSGDRTGELLVRQALPHAHERARTRGRTFKRQWNQAHNVSSHVHRQTRSFIYAVAPQPYIHICFSRHTCQHTLNQINPRARFGISGSWSIKLSGKYSHRLNIWYVCGDKRSIEFLLKAATLFWITRIKCHTQFPFRGPIRSLFRCFLPSWRIISIQGWSCSPCLGLCRVPAELLSTA